MAFFVQAVNTFRVHCANGGTTIETKEQVIDLKNISFYKHSLFMK